MVDSGYQYNLLKIKNPNKTKETTPSPRAAAQALTQKTGTGSPSPKETPIPQTPKHNPNIQKWAQPGLEEDFWRLDKIRHSSGPYKASSPLPKGVFPHHWQRIQMATCGNYSHTRILASRLPQYHRHLSKSTLASSYSHLLLSLNSLQFTGFPPLPRGVLTLLTLPLVSPTPHSAPPPSALAFCSILYPCYPPLPPDSPA